MPVIGFIGEDVEDNPQELSGNKKQEVIQEVKKTLIKIPESRIPKILEGFDCVVVNTFDDDYHCSDEEKEKRNKFAKEAKKIKSMKRIYRKLDEYVIAVREHLAFLDKVAEDNGIYEPEKFKSMFFKGKIDIVGMRFPKYKGYNRKEIDYKYLAEFILSDADPEEILPKWQRSDYEDEDPEELIDRLFTKEELDYILAPLSPEESRYDHEQFFVGEDKQDGTNVAVVLTNKETKKIIKAQPELLVKLKEIKRARNTYERLNDAFLHNSIVEDISELAAYEENYNYVSKAKVPEFKGDILDDKAYYKYMQKLKDFEDEHVFMNYHGKNKSLGEIRDLEVKEILERSGWNIRNFVENRIKEEKLKKIQKRDKKKEKELKKHLMDIQKRREARMEGKDYKDIDKKKKKKKKKEGKKKDLKNIKNNIREDMDNILLSTVGSNASSFKEYEERALDLTGLFGGDDDE